METQLKEVNYEMHEVKRKEKKKITHAVDIVLWALWAVLMWGFLLAITFISSPSDRPGIHELLITGYFLGFSIIFAVIYIIVLKRG